MLEVGQIYKKNGYTYCLIDIINYENKKYGLFSLESNKIAYIFYEIFETNNGYSLKRVNDEQLNFKLLEIIEKEED